MDDDRIEALIIRISELEARQARTEKILSKQRKVNEALLLIIEFTNWGAIGAALDKTYWGDIGAALDKTLDVE